MKSLNQFPFELAKKFLQKEKLTAEEKEDLKNAHSALYDDFYEGKLEMKATYSIEEKFRTELTVGFNLQRGESEELTHGLTEEKAEILFLFFRINFDASSFEA